jgi:hypothetical protein
MYAKITTKRMANAIAGTLGQPSKMPGMSYGIPASACKVGGKLQKVAGSTCSNCYALKANYQYPSVVKAQSTRIASLTHPQWVDAMVYLIANAPKDRRSWFRWHDSGDIQSIEHLENIVAIARQLPRIKFWLPTREQGIVRAYLAQFGDFPANLTVRVSAQMVDGIRPSGFKVTSGVHTVSTDGHACPAPKQGNQCRKCRACWDANVPHVSYHIH